MIDPNSFSFSPIQEPARVHTPFNSLFLHVWQKNEIMWLDLVYKTSEKPRALQKIEEAFKGTKATVMQLPSSSDARESPGLCFRITYSFSSMQKVFATLLEFYPTLPAHIDELEKNSESL